MDFEPYTLRWPRAEVVSIVNAFDATPTARTVRVEGCTNTLHDRSQRNRTPVRLVHDVQPPRTRSTFLTPETDRTIPLSMQRRGLRLQAREQIVEPCTAEALVIEAQA